MTCIAQHLIKIGLETCQCLPWYLNHTANQFQVCQKESALCFEEVTETESKNNSIFELCPKECNYTQYQLSQQFLELKQNREWQQVMAKGEPFLSLEPYLDPKFTRGDQKNFLLYQL